MSSNNLPAHHNEQAACCGGETRGGQLKIEHMKG